MKSISVAILTVSIFMGISWLILQGILQFTDNFLLSLGLTMLVGLIVAKLILLLDNKTCVKVIVNNCKRIR